MTRLPKRSKITLRAVFVLLAIAAHPIAWASAAEFRPLEPLADVKVGRFDKFVAADAFKIGTKIGGRALSAVGLNFRQHFMGVIENEVPAASLGRWTLLYTTGDRSLMTAVGGEREAALPFLAYVHALMDADEGRTGHTDWRSNFAYVRSPVDQRLWAVHWTVNYAGEWTIGAVYVPHPDLDWRSGSRLFSPRSFPAGSHALPARPPG